MEIKGRQKGAKNVRGVFTMKKNYDFSKSKQNPYAKKLKKPVTIRLDNQVISYFKQLALETGIPYQKLINLYLSDCVDTGRKIKMKWAA